MDMVKSRFFSWVAYWVCRLWTYHWLKKGGILVGLDGLFGYAASTRAFMSPIPGFSSDNSRSPVKTHFVVESYSASSARL